MTTATTLSALLPTYARADVTFVSGEGAWLVDADGKRYLDLLGGIAVVGLGHCHPAPLAAAHAQLDLLWHTSNLYSTEPMSALAGLLSARFGGARAFFCNSGAEAVEAALKWARKATGKPECRRAARARSTAAHTARSPSPASRPSAQPGSRSRRSRASRA